MEVGSMTASDSWSRAARKVAIAGLVGFALVLGGASSMSATQQSSPSRASAAHSFAYSGDEGPGFWGSLLPAWADCAVSKRQSPVNIANATRDLKPTPLHLDLKPTPIHLLNNGHTLEVEYGAGSTIRWRGTTYELLQFHFHTLSEHVVRGHHFAMEMHAVFKNPAANQYLVVGELFRIGSKSTFLSRFQSLLPEKSGGHADSASMVNLANGLVDTSHYWTYKGSLTTPPCSPVVTWIVLKRSATASRHQIEGEFWRIMGNNFRPPQPLNARIIHSTL